MKPPPFSYHDPQTVDEAVGLLGSLDNAKLLAGGQSLMPMLNFRFVQPDHIIDLNRVEGLSYIREAGGALEIGAMTRQRDLEFSDVVRAGWPIMHEALLQVGHRQTRNRGTIGGSLCHLDPAAELVSLATGHDATVTVAGPNGAREIPFAEFPVAYMTPAIELERDLVRRALSAMGGRPRLRVRRVLAPPRRFRHHVGGGAAGGRRGRQDHPRLGRPSAAWARRRSARARWRQAIIGQVPTASCSAPPARAAASSRRIDDVHAPRSYRQHLAAVLSRRALEKACARLRRRTEY